MRVDEIREKYLSFFESKGHLRVASYPLIPHNDKSLLLINSGMAPLKPFFTGMEVPPRKRVATCQKCIRTDDIENVGVTSRHMSFFEMLGNFSFGDYFKNEVIPWAWEFVTEIMEISPDKLYVTIYKDDDEAFDIWRGKVGVDISRIIRMDDNFWEVGVGPCGPCSEIYYDRGEEHGCGGEGCTVGCDCDRYVEIWNLVFTQFKKEENGSYSKLSFPNIDTGMGLERMAAVMQGVNWVSDIDTMKRIRERVCAVIDVKYNEDSTRDRSIRIITDHIRAVTFMTADGVLPSNEGRGYVLRRLLRRAARHGKLLGVQRTFISEVSGTVIETFSGAYPELAEKREHIEKVLEIEETRFNETLDQGLLLFQGLVERVKKRMETVMPGEMLFKMYDTFGFPLELMKEILNEQGLLPDEKSFQEEMEHQRERARAARDETNFMGAAETVFSKLDAKITTAFLGYDNNSVSDVRLLHIVSGNELTQEASEGAQVSVILDKTPLYATSGGQAGDSGTIKTTTGIISVSDCFKAAGNKFVHSGVVTEGTIRSGDICTVEIDTEKRMSTARNHTATHLLQAALRGILGAAVEQAGSNVSHDKLSFDFTHMEQLTPSQLAAVEDIVNEKILDALNVRVSEMPVAEARKMGAMALFGEKYGDVVRVVDISGYSVELCGGTHLTNTSRIGSFKILSEKSVASGVRRIEAVTGRVALSYYKELHEHISMASAALKVSPSSFLSKIQSFMSDMKALQQKAEQLSSQLALGVVDDIVSPPEHFDSPRLPGCEIVAAQAGDMDAAALRSLGDRIKDRIHSGVLVLAAVHDGKVSIVVMATDDAVKAGVHAGNVVKASVAVLGGGGGGRPNMAQAGGKDTSKVREALECAKNVIREQLS